jgi:hypothetical protein
MPTFELQFPAHEIEPLADRFGQVDESRLLATGAAVRARGHYTRPEFMEACAWKSPDSLGVKPRSQYPVSFWLEYLSACRELARRHGVSIRTLDKALWQHSKERARPS